MRADETEALDDLEAWVRRLQETSEFLAAIYSGGIARKRSDVHLMTEFSRAATVALEAAGYVRARPDTLQVSSPGSQKELLEVKRRMGPAAVLEDVLGRIEVELHVLVKHGDAGAELQKGLGCIQSEIQRRVREAARSDHEALNNRSDT